MSREFLSAQQREPVVRVKELEWSKDSIKGSYPARYKATTLGDFGDYTVAGDERENEWQWFRNGFFARGHYLHNPMTLEHAKSAAQADYEQRIMAAIEIIPAGAVASSDGGAKAGSSPILASEEDKRAGAHGVMSVGTIADAAGCTDAGPSEAYDGGSPGPSPLAVSFSASDLASGRSQPSPDVSVDELLLRLDASQKACFDAGLHIAAMDIQSARALLARYKIERLDRLAGGRR